ncbi:MAG: hypothetical protein LBM04_00710 [Opitutaceae bacterium]|jgi:hypothetical protein|nr:hypothetical protein [Opitutaceae bacterium]
MKKTILLATALAVSAATAATAIAAPLDSKGIPADADGIIHVDLELCAKTAIGAAIKQFSEKTLVEKNTGREDYERFKKQTGIDPEKDISGVTIGLFKPDGGTRMPSAIAVVRGTFSPDKIIAAAKENKCAVTTRGALTLIDATTLAAASRGAVGDDSENDEPAAPAKTQTAFAGIVDKNTILVAETAAIVEKAAATLSGDAGSYAPPAVLDTFGKQEGAPMLLACFTRGLANDAASSMPILKAENILVALSEKGSSLRARIYSEYATPEAARKTRAAVQMLIGVLQMGAASSDSAEAAEQMQNLQRLIDSLKINLHDKSLDITADYPVAALIEQMKKYNAGE